MDTERHLFGLLTILILTQIAQSKVIINTSNDGLSDIICVNKSINALIVHPYDCMAYYQCVENEYGIIKYCANNTWFNDKTQLCDDSFNECMLSDHNEIDVVTNTASITQSDTTIIIPPSSTAVAEYSQLPQSSSTTTEIFTSLVSTVPSPTTISTSLIPTTIKPSSTPTTINYSTTSPTIKPFDDDVTTETLSFVSPTTLPTSIRPTPPRPPPPPPVDTIHIDCPKFDTPYLTYISNKIDCSSYYLCYHGQPMKLYCPPRYHWHIEFKKCVPASQTSCHVTDILYIIV